MIKVYFESKNNSIAELKFIFDKEKDFDNFHDWNLPKGMIRTESIHDDVRDIKDVIAHCHGCAYKDNYHCNSFNRSIFDVEEYDCFTCDRNCSCDDLQSGEPLHCELIPEELHQLIKNGRIEL